MFHGEKNLSVWIIPVSVVAMLVVFLLFPGSGLERLIFIEDSLWGISWLLIARQSFVSRRSGYPPRAIGITLGVELYLMFHYAILHPWPFHPWLLLNYILWPLASFFNLAAILFYSRDEVTRSGAPGKAAIILALEICGWFLLFRYLAQSLPQHLVMAYLGQTVILAISVHFLYRLHRRKDRSGMSRSGNVLRVLAGILCFGANFLLRREELTAHPYLLSAMALSVVADLFFIYSFTINGWRNP